MRKLILLASFPSMLGACAATPAIGYAPNTSAEERDELHRTAPPPEIASERKLRSATVTDVFNVPLHFIPDWFIALPLEEALPGSDEIPGVSRTEALGDEPWGEEGARRRVVLNDGSTALEEVMIASLPERFRYVVWNYTSDAAKHVRYGVGEFRFTPERNGTRVEWTYSLAPNGWPATWFLRRFVKRDYREMMEASLQAMKRNAETSWHDEQYDQEPQPGASRSTSPIPGQHLRADVPKARRSSVRKSLKARRAFSGLARVK